MEYTPEPWYLFNTNNTTAIKEKDIVRGPEVVAWMGFDRSERTRKEHVANARRIVACVNACAGIPTETLEADSKTLAYVLTNIHHEILKVEQQRDMLLEALKVNEEHIRNGAELVFGAAKQMIIFRCDEIRAIIKQVESQI